jgi:hypothetical protein
MFTEGHSFRRYREGIFADYCSTQIGSLNSDDSITWTSAFSGNNFSTFGVNNQNELFVAAVNSGKIFRITTTTLGSGK